MEDENRRQSRRIRGLEPEIPATVGDYIPVEPHMDDETVRYEDEDTP